MIAVIFDAILVRSEIKVLPAAASSDPEADGRFEREARALASLSHPRICSLFEFTRFDGLALLNWTAGFAR
jgi:serine/threonine protein kinase